MPDVHWHLRRRSWSIREGGRVVGYVPAIALRDVQFVVSAAGCTRVRLRQQREVVAHARGTLAESGPVPLDAQRVRFDPYRAFTFTLPDGSPINEAAFVSFLADGSCWAVSHPGVSPCVPSSPPSC